MIRLTKVAIPTLSPDLRSITRHASFCGVCLNLSPAVAEACIGGREHLYSNGQAWDFTSTFGDLLAAANDGCGSCRILRGAIEGVFPGVVVWSEESWEEKEIMTTMVEANVLRVYLPDFFETVKDGVEVGLNTDFLQPNALFELYALEGRSLSCFMKTIAYPLLITDL
jgi:hypothetical protein